MIGGDRLNDCRRGRIEGGGAGTRHVDMKEHQLGRRQQAGIALPPHRVMEMQALRVVGQQLGGDGQAVAAVGLVQIVDMRFQRIDRAGGRPPRGVVQPDIVVERVGGMAEDEDVIGLVHVAVVVDPFGQDGRPVQDERGRVRHLSRPASGRGAPSPLPASP